MFGAVRGIVILYGAPVNLNIYCMKLHVIVMLHTELMHRAPGNYCTGLQGLTVILHGGPGNKAVIMVILHGAPWNSNHIAWSSRE